MIAASASRTLDDLTPTEFENLVFDLMVNLGMSNVQWRTPGADGGRDIEGLVTQADFSGYRSTQTWYVECKRYQSSISWPTIYEKVAHAEVEEADVLLLCTQSTISAPATTKINEWNSQRRPVTIRAWPRHDLELRLSSHPDLLLKYRLTPLALNPGRSFVELSLSLSKTLGSYYSKLESDGQSPEPMLEAAHAISALLYRRMDDMERKGKIVPAKTGAEAGGVVIAPPADALVDQYGLRAYIAFLAALSGSKIEVEFTDKSTCVVKLQGMKHVSDRYGATLAAICIWSDFDAAVEEDKVTIHQREAV